MEAGTTYVFLKRQLVLESWVRHREVNIAKQTTYAVCRNIASETLEK